MLSSITTRTALFGVIVAVVPVLAISVYGLVTFSRASTEVARAHFSSNLRITTSGMHAFLDAAEDDVRLQSQADVFEKGNPGRIANYLDEIRVEIPQILETVFYDRAGREVARSSARPLLPADIGDADPELAGLMARARAGRQGDAWVSGAHKFGDQSGLFVVTPVTDEANDSVIGALFGFISIGLFRTWLEQNIDELHPESFIYLVDRDGRVLLSTDPRQADFGAPRTDTLADFLAATATSRELSSHAIGRNPERGEVLFVRHGLDEVGHPHALGWSLVAAVPMREIVMPMLRVRDAVIIFAVVLMLLAAAAGVLGARTIVRPIRQLVALSRDLARGDGAVAAEIRGPAEVGVLAEALVAAFDDLNRHTRALERTGAVLEHAQTISHVGSWEHDLATGEVVWSNQQYRLFGYQPGAVAPSHDLVRRHLHADDRAEVEALRAEAVADRRSQVECEHRIEGADGATRWVNAVYTFDYDADGRLIRDGGVLQDITAARRLKEELIQAQRMEALGRLTGGIAHDFNNVLTVVMGNLDLVRTMLPDEASAQQRVGLAFAAAERCAELTHRLLAFARRQILQPAVVDLNETVKGVHDLFKHSLGEEIDIEFVLAGGLWLCEADPVQLESALLNLALNARDAMPDGGRLTIETANVDLDEPGAAAQLDVFPGQYVMVAVSDTGIGMSEAVRTSALEPFFTTKGVGEGSGLGLSMVHGFVSQSDGYLRIYSELGRGTTVKMFFPRSASAAADAAPEAAASMPRGNGERVLVVEDDRGVRAITVTALNQLGYRVLEADDGPSALQLAAREPGIDLLLTDIALPGGMNGRQLSEALLTEVPGLGVVFMSGYTSNAILHQGRLDPDVEFLPKPFRRSDLARALRRALDAE